MSAKILFLILIDSLILLLACLLSGFSQDEAFKIYFILCPIVLFMFFIEGLYTFETYNPDKLSISLLRGMSFATLLGFSLIRVLSSEIKISQHLSIVAIGLIVPYGINLARKIFFEILTKDFMMQNAVIIGASDTLEIVQQEANKKPFMGYRIRQMVMKDDDGLMNLPEGTNLVAIERKFLKSPAINREVISYLESGVEMMDLAYFTEKLSGKIPLQSIDESWFIEHCAHSRSSSYAIAKRCLDIIAALMLMVILIPIAAIVIPVLLIFHGRPLFFSQIRTGLNNKPFRLYKLRSMVVNAEKNGAQWSKPGDMRITTIGKWLRKTRLDELPQLWNILKGEMSLVGPRPERPEIIKSTLEGEVPYYNLRHLVKPGVTGWAQVSFRYGFSKEDSFEKLQYDLFFVKNRSIQLDIVILLKTIKTVLTGAGQ